MIFHTSLLGFPGGSWVAAPKAPGIQIKLVSHQPSLMTAAEKTPPAQKEETNSEQKAPEKIEENTENTQETKNAESKKVITTRAEKKKTQKESDTLKTKSLKKTEPSQPPAPSVSQQTAGESVEELANPQARSTQSDEFQKWVAQLQYRINRYKVYPYQAKRRRLVGEVKIEAEINADGTLGKARVLAGKRAFETSSLRAIERSLPLPTPHNKPVTVILSINYRLL
ncbi:hypothetical protein GZ78_20330 [Endozoicomonas numazuensis]|uniref:TonB C-terminal domain-containing protein n=1 Tax=Endozoicomonas numazuensis TaxID=1137799 RepID=A0A081NEV1_9GAMM|nr:hypothetical protein GZ78_20330 [Endozoicomonas numazuensis]